MENTNRILNREEIPEKYKWAIHDLYPTDEAWHDHLATLEEDKQAMSAMAGTLGESGQALYTYLHRMEEVDEKVYRLSNYCMRKADEDTRNATYQAMVGKYRGVQVALNAAISFDVPEIMAISDETLDRFYAEYPQLERYRRYLTNLRRKKAHTLSAEQEQLLAAAGEIAHTPDSIENVLGALRSTVKGRLTVLFGCGGDRDRTKRPLMAAAAARYADHLIVTSDNPRTEDPEAIIAEILPGLEGSDVSRETIVNRREAIFHAVKTAKPGDTIVLVGKGHEDYQIIGTEKFHFDEREVVAEALAALK